MVRGPKRGFKILPIYPTKAPTQSIKLHKEYKFCGDEVLALVTSISGEQPGERTLNCDIYKIKKDGYIILQMNEGYS